MLALLVRKSVKTCTVIEVPDDKLEVFEGVVAVREEILEVRQPKLATK